MSALAEHSFSEGLCINFRNTVLARNEGYVDHVVKETIEI
jgi:hypothetical protein